MTVRHPQNTRPEWRPRLAGRQLTEEKQERGLNYFGIANSSEKFFFHETNIFFSFYRLVHQKHYILGVFVLYIMQRSSVGFLCRKVKKIELSNISRATCSQIGQSRFVHFILRCHSVIVISHLSQIYCCFYSDLRT